MWQVPSPVTLHPVLVADSGACLGHQRPGKALGLCLGLMLYGHCICWPVAAWEKDRGFTLTYAWSAVNCTAGILPINTFVSFRMTTKSPFSDVVRLRKPSGIGGRVLEASMKPSRWELQLISLVSLPMFHMQRASQEQLLHRIKRMDSFSNPLNRMAWPHQVCASRATNGTCLVVGIQWTHMGQSTMSLLVKDERVPCPSGITGRVMPLLLPRVMTEGSVFCWLLSFCIAASNIL